MKKPKVSYDPETDALMVDLSDEPSVESYEAAQNVIIAVDANGDAVAIEFLGRNRELFAPLIQQIQKQQHRAAS